MNRRNLLTFLASSLSVTACSNNVALKTISSAYDVSFGNSSAFEPDYPDKLPYASIAVRQKGLARSLLVLGRVSGDELHWVSADRGILVTRHGRLIRTVGFAENISKTDLISHDFFNGKTLPIKDAKSATRIVDFLPGNRYGIKIESTIETNDKETVEIGKYRFDTTRYTETCVAPQLGWKFTNSFWLDDQGRTWRSTQHFSPNIEPLTIEVMKPYLPA